MSQSEIIYRDPNEFLPHPRNGEFFSDIAGSDWSDFLNSIRDRGVLNPLLVTSQDVIVSGHQRLRAVLELGIKTVPCIVLANSENENAPNVLMALIETNIRQRGGCRGSSTKQQLAIADTLTECTDRLRWEAWMEWKVNHCDPKDEPALLKAYTENQERSFSIERIRSDLHVFKDELEELSEQRKRDENAQRKQDENFDKNLTKSEYTDFVKYSTIQITEADLKKKLAETMGVSESWIEKLRSLSTLCPTLLDRIDEGQISADAASRLLTKLSPTEQETFLSHLPDDLTQKITRKQTEAIVAQMREESRLKLDAANARVAQSEQALRQREAELSAERSRLTSLQNEISSLQSKRDAGNGGNTAKQLHALQKQLDAKIAECESTQQKVRFLQHALINEADTSAVSASYNSLDSEAELFTQLADNIDQSIEILTRQKNLSPPVKTAVERAQPLITSLKGFIKTYIA